jgi:hypothetical protein
LIEMDAEASSHELMGEYLRPRLRIIGGAFLVGAVVAGGLVLAFTVAGWSPVRAARLAFVLAVLTFGGGLFGWAGSAMVGRDFERMQTHLGTRTNWTEMKSRRAMARIGAFGTGAMVTAGVLEVVVLVAI